MEMYLDYHVRYDFVKIGCILPITRVGINL